MKILAFSKRNLKEIIRDPLSLVFNLLFPVLLLLVFRLITASMSEEELNFVPQFKIEKLAPNIAMFSFSFLTLFMSLLISKDRTTSFLSRLKTSPMKTKDFFIGYVLPVLPIAFIQIIICFAISFLFGLKIGFNLFLTILCLMPILLLFILLGVLIGISSSDKAAPGISSLIINFAAIFGGIFMPLDTMNNTFKKIAYLFPFAPSSKMVSMTVNGNYENFLYYFSIVLIYDVLLVGLVVILFNKRLKGDKM